MTSLSNLTAGDLGILAAALDDARRLGLGDDDTVDYVACEAAYEKICSREMSRDVAYDFMRAN